MGLLMGALLVTGCGREQPVRKLGVLPDATFHDQTGQEVSLSTLRGRPAIVNFVFTRCPDRCPVFTARFANLQRSLKDRDVQYVSISVDPEYDTPAVLADYATRYEADSSRWHFLTGSLEPVQRSVIDAFLRHLEGRAIQGQPDLMEIVHGELFLLIDAEGQIRGFYGSDEHGTRRLRESLVALSHG